MVWKQLLGYAPFFTSVALAVAFAISYRAFRARRARRSPLASRQIGHVPGQQLVDRIADHDTEILLSIMLMYMALPFGFMGWAGTRIDWNRLSWGFMEGLSVCMALALLLYGMRDFIRHVSARDRVRDGLLAERVTGMQLNRLIAKDCIVLHDLPAEGFNIDHVVIAPRGVYAVETKSFRKARDVSDNRSDPSHQVHFDGSRLRFPDFATAEPIEQALRQAQWLRSYLRNATGRDIAVTPVVALPGWFVVPNEQVWHTAPVKVFSPMGDGANFMAKDLPVLSRDVRHLIATCLAQRFPAVPA